MNRSWLRPWQRSLTVITGISILLAACGGSDRPGSGQIGALTPLRTSEVGTARPTATALDPQPCLGRALAGEPKGGGALELLDLPNRNLHVDVADTIISGVVQNREVVAVPVSVHGEQGPNVTPLSPPDYLGCIGRYGVGVSRVLKNANGDDLPSNLTVTVYEGEAYPGAGQVIEVLSPMAVESQVILFLYRLGESGEYGVIGPRYQVTATGVRALGGYHGYALEVERNPVSEFTSAIESRVAEVPGVRPLTDVLDDIETPEAGQ